MLIGTYESKVSRNCRMKHIHVQQLLSPTLLLAVDVAEEADCLVTISTSLP